MDVIVERDLVRFGVQDWLVLDGLTSCYAVLFLWSLQHRKRQNYPVHVWQSHPTKQFSVQRLNCAESVHTGLIYWNHCRYCPPAFASQEAWGRSKIGFPPNSSEAQISHNLACPYHPFQLSSRFEMLHRARQWHCRALCEISKRFDDWKLSNRQIRFREIWVQVSQITSLTIVYSTVYSDADERKHQSAASLAFVQWIHRGLVNSPHKWPVTRKMFPFNDVIMWFPPFYVDTDTYILMP